VLAAVKYTKNTTVTVPKKNSCLSLEGPLCGCFSDKALEQAGAVNHRLSP
jgi:hypothetical protein